MVDSSDKNDTATNREKSTDTITYTRHDIGADEPQCTMYVLFYISNYITVEGEIKIK